MIAWAKGTVAAARSLVDDLTAATIVIARWPDGVIELLKGQEDVERVASAGGETESHLIWRVAVTNNVQVEMLQGLLVALEETGSTSAGQRQAVARELATQQPRCTNPADEGGRASQVGSSDSSGR